MNLSLASVKSIAFAHWRYALAVAALLVGGYLLFGRSADFGATMVISQADFREEVRVSGAVTAAQDVDLGFATNGRIARTYAKVGQHVWTGTILAETENGDLLATLAQEQADLAALEAGTRPEELEVAATTVTNAKAALVNAIQNAYTTSDDAVRNRVDPLFSNPRTNPQFSLSVTNALLGMTVESDRAATELTLVNWALMLTKLSSENAAISAKQAQTYLAQVTTLLADANLALNQSVPDQTTSAATISSYKTTLATARTNVDTTATALTTAAAALDAAESSLSLKQAGSTSEAIAAQRAAVAAAAAKVVATRVIAPFPGIVTRMDANVGEIVSPTTSEISMQSDGIFEIETYVPEVNIARVARGNAATTTLDTYGSAVEFPATVIAVDPAETLKDGVPTYKTTLAFLVPDPRIRSGMTANVTIVTGTLHDAVVIPSGAVGTKAGAPYVSVIEQGKAVSRAVVTGPSPALGQAHILSGLSAGDVILLAPVP